MNTLTQNNQKKNSSLIIISFFDAYSYFLSRIYPGINIGQYIPHEDEIKHTNDVFKMILGYIISEERSLEHSFLAAVYKLMERNISQEVSNDICNNAFNLINDSLVRYLPNYGDNRIKNSISYLYKNEYEVHFKITENIYCPTDQTKIKDALF